MTKLNALLAKRMWLALALVVGLLMLYEGFHLATWSSGQEQFYNMGLQAYRQGDMQKAIACFDRSVASYIRESRAPWTHRFLYPAPSRELAAMAFFHKAKAQLRKQDMEGAVASFKNSLRLNPGDQYGAMAAKEIERLHEEALIVKYDLELLFKFRPDIAQAQGKGKGKPEDDTKQAPGSDPSTQPGRGGGDDI